MSAESWRDRAACRDLSGLFCPDEDYKLSTSEIARAKAICATCPVLADCASDTARVRTKTGVWAGVHHSGPDADDPEGPRFEMWKEGKTDRQIAEAVGVQRETIRTWRSSRNLPANVDHFAATAAASQARTEQRIRTTRRIARRRAQGCSAAQIARELKLSIATVNRRIREITVENAADTG